MSKPSTLKKYLRTVKLLQDSLNKYHSLKNIKAHLKNHGFDNISDRTLFRDFDTLREEFGIPLEYCTRYKGWFINTDSDQDLEDYKQFIKLLELAERVETITQTLQQTSTASQSIVFEQRDFFKGSDHLSLLVDAIARKIVIAFKYKSYEKDRIKIYEIEPFLVTEYSNRWYLLGWDVEADKLKTFGLDRMEDITCTDTFTTKDRGFSYKTLFKNTYGITCLDEEPQSIVLSFTSKQGNYLKSLPLHASQQILTDTLDEFKIELKVVINYELKKEIMSYGDNVKVLEPVSLQEEIINNLKNALKSYLP